MKNHEVAIMEVAGEFFDKGYHVYFYPHIYRYPQDDPILFKKKYVPDLFAIKNDDYVLIEIGLCEKEKLLDLKRLVPSARVLHITQWKNFSICEGLKQISGYSIEIPKREKLTCSKSRHKWTVEETNQIVALCQKGATYEEISKKLPLVGHLCIATHVRSLCRKGVLLAEPVSLSETKSFVWNITDVEKLITLYEKGLDFRSIAKAFPEKTYCQITAKIARLHKQNKVQYRGHPVRWSSSEDQLLVKLWSEGKTVKQIHTYSEFSFRAINSVIARVSALRRLGLITFCRLPPKHSQCFTSEENILFWKLYCEGKSYGEINKYFPLRSYRGIIQHAKLLRRRYGKSSHHRFLLTNS